MAVVYEKVRIVKRTNPISAFGKLIVLEVGDVLSIKSEMATMSVNTFNIAEGEVGNISTLLALELVEWKVAEPTN